MTIGRISGRSLENVYPALALAADYAARNIVLDSPMQNRQMSCADLTASAYNGPLPVGADTTRDPVVFQEAVRLPAAATVPRADVTQLNAVAHFGISLWFTPDVDAAGVVLSKVHDATHRIQIEHRAGGVVRVEISDGAGTFGDCAANAAMAGYPCHVFVAYDGTLATDALKCKVWINGVVQVLAVTGPFPAVTPDLVGHNLIQGGAGSQVHHSLRVWSVTPTAADAAAEYLAGSRKVNFDAPLNDVPAIVGVNTVAMSIGDWDLQLAFKVGAGTWDVTVDGAGQHWLTCTAAGRAYREDRFLFGTRNWNVIPGASTFLGMGSVNGVHDVAAQNGYFLEFGAGTFYFGETVAGVYTRLFPLGAYTPGATYEVMLSGVSQGLWDVWIKGGAEYVTWMHLGPMSATTVTATGFVLAELGNGESFS
jgi:hypothetical protein